MRDTQEFQKQVGRIDELVRKLESSADPSLRGTARDLVQSLMELHGAGLERILEIVSSTGGEAGAVLVKSLSHDELVSSLLVLYGLHPENFETRVRRGLDKVRPFLRSRGARLDVIAIEGDQVRVKIHGPASTELQEAVREALLETAPDAAEISIEGGVDKAPSSSFVPLTSLRSSNGSAVVLADAGRL
jgi:NifU-like domain